MKVRSRAANNTGTFYYYVNKRLSRRPNISSLGDAGSNVVVADADKANLFNRYFASVGVVDNGCSPHCSTVTNHLHCLDTVLFTEKNVSDAIDKLKCNLSYGPYELPPMMFKHLISSSAIGTAPDKDSVFFP